MYKKLKRKTEGQMLCGVCAGLAEYFCIDVTIVRILTVAACFGSGFGVVGYIAAAVIMPTE